MPDKQISSDSALQAFKQTLNLAKETSATLVDSQSGGKLLSTAAGVSDSGVCTLIEHHCPFFLRNITSIDDLSIMQDLVIG